MAPFDFNDNFTDVSGDHEAHAHRGWKVCSHGRNASIRGALFTLITAGSRQIIQFAAGNFTALGRQHTDQVAAVNVILVLTEFFLWTTRWAEKVADDHIGQLIANRSRCWGSEH